MKLWMIRSEGEAGVRADDFLECGIITIEGEFVKNLNLKDYYTDEAFSRLANLWREAGKKDPKVKSYWEIFGREMQIRDWVITHDKKKDLYYMGRIESDYICLNGERDGWRHRRAVDWLREGIARENLTEETKKILGTSRTIYQIKEAGAIEELKARFGIKS